MCGWMDYHSLTWELDDGPKAYRHLSLASAFERKVDDSS